MVAATTECRIGGADRGESRSEIVMQPQLNKGLFAQALLNFLGGVRSAAERLPHKLLYKLENRDRQPRIYDFNTFLLTERFHEFFSEFVNRDDAMYAFLELAKKDFRTWVEEYVLHSTIGQFEYDVVTDERGDVALKTPEYRKIALMTMAQNAVKRFAQMGEPTNRLEADTISVARLMDWANRPNARSGDVAFSASPYDKDNRFYKNYSFIFKRELVIQPDGTRRVITTQYKTWHSHEHITRILREIGCPIAQQTTLTDQALAASFFPVQQNVSDAQVMEIFARYPNRTQIPDEFKPIRPKNPEEFAKAMQTAEEFVLRVIEEQYSGLLKNPTPQNEILVARIIEETVGSYAKRYLTERAAEDSRDVPNYATRPLVSPKQLYDTSMAYIRHRYFKEKLSKAEAEALTSNLKGIFGYLGPIVSAGQCWGGSLSSMMVQANGSASHMVNGLTPELLGTHIVGQHAENCPNCKKRMMVSDLANGDVLCPGCGQVKLCGKSEHQLAAPATRQKVAPAHHEVVPKKRAATAPHHSQRQTEPSIDSATDFFGSMFIGMFTGGTVTT